MGRKKYFVDRKGKPITKGCKVKWYDPEEKARDLSRILEVLPHEVEIVA
jgi:hypothetical protein